MSIADEKVPRPRAFTLEAAAWGRGPMIDSKGSESDPLPSEVCGCLCRVFTGGSADARVANTSLSNIGDAERAGEVECLFR